MKSKPGTACLLPLAALALQAGPVLGADDVDTSNWVCEYCPFEEGHRGDYDVGATTVSDDSAFFGNATGYDEEGVYPNLDARGAWSKEQNYVRWNVEDLGLDSRVVNVDGGRTGRFDYHFDWSELPYRQFITTSTVFGDTGNAALALPGDWVRAPTTAGFTALDANLSGRPIASDRRDIGVGGRYRITDAVSVRAAYRQRNNEGIRSFGGGSFTSASLLPAPFDYTTDEVEIGVDYRKTNAHAGLSWYLSDFNNRYESLSWQQPFSSAPGAGNPAMAQAPDNRFQQFRLTGGYAFSQWRTVVNVVAAMGEIEQDEAFLPYTTNPNLTPDALPQSSLGGAVDTSNFLVAVQARPLPKTRIRLSYRYDERDNRTRSTGYSRVIVDSFLSGEVEQNLPFGYERNRLSVEGHWDALKILRLSAGYERRELDRTLQEVTSEEEDSSYGRARLRPIRSLEFDARYGNSRRDNDGYDVALALAAGQNPLLRKYNMAFRFREFYDLRVNWSPAGLPVSLNARALLADDSYSRSELGLTDGEEESYALDFNWFITEQASLFLNAGVDDIASTQLGSEAGGNPDWLATNDDNFTSLGAGLNIRNIADKIDLRLSALRSRGESRIAIDSALSGDDRFPDLENELDRVRVEVLYRRSDALDLTFNASYQRFRAADWALQGVTPNAVPLLFSLGAEPYNEDNIIVGFGVRYRALSE